jgi:hypothetical protein
MDTNARDQVLDLAELTRQTEVGGLRDISQKHKNRIQDID